MKQKISITLDEETVVEIQNQLRSGRFRNKSHVVEYAVLKLLEEENGRNP
ncbi:type II toxin-antitoxin system ParD family antitoxin [Candidatus Woesearchaeota archaeon]|nr:type II toxin-antitoxin system ParD family antitoxin [Candidatus Woesearchaeota archaeon]